MGADPPEPSIRFVLLAELHRLARHHGGKVERGILRSCVNRVLGTVRERAGAPRPSPKNGAKRFEAAVACAVRAGELVDDGATLRPRLQRRTSAPAR
jgi:hypothetical protein